MQGGFNSVCSFVFRVACSFRQLLGMYPNYEYVTCSELFQVLCGQESIDGVTALIPSVGTMRLVVT